MGALLCSIWILGSSVGCQLGEADRARPNVLVIMIDTLRSDHLPFYGYSRDTAPAVRRLAEDAWVFENHIAHSGHTVPSTLSLMLSQTPAEHGFVHRAPLQFAEAPPRYGVELSFLSEAFAANGYATVGLVSNPFLKPLTGFAQGFGAFAYIERGEDITLRASSWVRNHRKDRPEEPFFAYLHYLEVHNPYTHPPEYAQLYTRDDGGKIVYENGPIPGIFENDLHFTVASYDAGINRIDDQLKILFELLDELELREDTIIVFTSDHGDEFLEHGGLGHGTTVFGEQVRVPLVIAYPGVFEGGRRIAHMSQHVDLGPTLLALAGIPIPKEFDGTSILEPAPAVFSEDRVWRSVYADGHKLIRNLETGKSFLFDAADLLDEHPLQKPEVEAALSLLLDEYIARGESAAEEGGTQPGEWTEREAEQLRALGYIE